MSIEELKAELAELKRETDQFYMSLAPVLHNLGILRNRFRSVTTGSSKDLSAIEGLFSAAHEGFYGLLDPIGSISTAIETLASEY